MTSERSVPQAPPAVRRRVSSVGSRLRILAAAVLAAGAIFATPAPAASLTGYKGFEQSFGFKGDQPSKEFSFKLLHSTAPANVFWPGDETSFTFQVENLTDKPLAKSGKIDLVSYSTASDPDDTFNLFVKKGKDIGSEAVSFNLPAKGFTQVTVKLPVPATFGAWAAILNIDGVDKMLVATCVRTMAATPGKVQFPAYALDVQNPAIAPMFKRIGVKGTRSEIGYFTTNDENTAKEKARVAETLKAMSDNDITVMWTVATGGDYSKMPLGRIRGYLNDKAEGKLDYPGDFSMLPKYDEDFQKWCKEMSEQFGWPKGPVNAIELWNEPWEGISISGWGGDMLRYRELYTRMAQGIVEGRKSGTQVLIGGACSSMNTEDKLFCDGNDEPFLKWLDFTSIHYQPMSAQPALNKRFAERKSPNGPTRVWDTESWIANSEDRVAGVIASMRAQGQSRTAGVLHDAARDVQDVDVRDADGKSHRTVVVQALAPAGAIAAMESYIGERPFKEILFKNGLPWVFVFDGDKGPDDGTVVVVGDLGGSYDRNLLLFRTVLGQEARKRSITLRKQLDAMPATATEEERKALLNKIKQAEVLDHAEMTLADGDRHFHSLDFFGNTMPSNGGKISVPLNGLGYFLRTDGSAGSFAKLLDAIKKSHVDGYEAVEVVAHDLLSRVDSKPALRLSLTNVLNRPVSAKLDVKLGNLQLEDAAQTVKLEPNETKELSLKVSGGQAAPDNTYPLSVTVDAGADGKQVVEESLHVNVIAHKTITVDGNLDDWKDVLPQPIRSAPGAGKNLTEKAWLPFVKFDEQGGQGFASGYMAYDESNFYFAAKIADSTPYEGNVRFAKRDDDSYFYPDVAYNLQEQNGKTVRGEPLQWPAGVRHFSYRRNPDLPSGADTDNVQIGFNVLPLEKTDWLAYPTGTMPRFEVYKTTDYEYALNAVASQYGGGAELWRLIAPGVPRKHFYPRQPKVAAGKPDQGPVDNGKLIMKRDGNTRLVECAIPWSELPDVKKKLDAGEAIKFTFRVNDNKGPSYELNSFRSVSKANSYALHDYWATSWATETEFTFEKK